MSQEKVDKYKEAKKTRKEDLAKQKKKNAVNRLLGWIIGCVVVAGLILILVISIVNQNKAKREAMEQAFSADNFVLDDLTGGDQTEEEAEEDTEAEDAAEE